MAEGDAGGGDAFAVGLHALRAYRPLFAAFQLDEYLCQYRRDVVPDIDESTYLSLPASETKWKVSRLLAFHSHGRHSPSRS